MIIVIVHLIFTVTSVFSLPQEYSNWIPSLLKEKIDNGAEVLNRGLEFGNNAVQLVEGLKGDATKLVTGFTNSGISAGVNLSSQGLDGATGLASQGLDFINAAVQMIGCPIGKAVTKLATDISKNGLNAINTFGQSGLNMFGRYFQGKLIGVNNLAQRKYDTVSKLSYDGALLGQKGINAGADALKTAIDFGSSAVNSVRSIFGLSG